MEGRRKKRRTDEPSKIPEASSSSSEATSSAVQTPPKELLECLNRLAWLMERNSKSCTAVSFVKSKLIIADNNISQSTLENNKVFLFIKEVMDYFIWFVSFSNESTNELNSEKREKIFRSIFKNKFRGEQEGYLIPISEYKKKIEDGLIAILKISFDAEKSKEVIIEQRNLIQNSLIKLAKHSKPLVALAYQIGIDIIRRIKGIERFLTQAEYGNSHLFKAMLISWSGSKRESEEKDENIENDALIKVRYSGFHDASFKDANWICDDKNTGYCILVTNNDSVHAESKIIDFLLATAFLNMKKLLSDYICIGISKACCLSCADVIRIINDYFKEKGILHGDYIYVTSAHNREFEWVEPCFMTEIDSNEIQVEGPYYFYSLKEKAYLDSIPGKNEKDEVGEEGVIADQDYIKYQRRNNSFEKYIQEKFFTLQTNFKLALYHYEGDYEIHRATHKAAVKYLKDSLDKSHLVVYQHAKDKHWYWIGYDFMTSEIKRFQLEETPLMKRSSNFKKTLREKILKLASEKLGRKVVAKQHMAQESPSSSATTSEHEQEISEETTQAINEAVLKLLKFNNDIREGKIILEKQQHEELVHRITLLKENFNKSIEAFISLNLEQNVREAAKLSSNPSALYSGKGFRKEGEKGKKPNISNPKLI